MSCRRSRLTRSTPPRFMPAPPAGVYSSADAGGTWVRTGLADERVEALAVDAAGTIYAGLRGSGAFKSTDGGVIWTAAREGLSDQHVMSLKPSASNPGLVYAGTRTGIFKTTDSADHWSVLHPAQDVYAVEISGQPGRLYAGVHGGLIRSTDGGNEWTQLELKCAAHAILTASTDILYAGTHRGVFQSPDGGTTWQPANTGLERAFVHALMADPSDPNTLYAGSVGMFDPGGVFRSTNGGASWARIGEGDINQLMFSVSGPRTLSLKNSIWLILRGHPPLVSVVQPTDFGNGDNLASIGAAVRKAGC